MYILERVYAEFSAFLNKYERDHATDDEDVMLLPIYVPDTMRRRMIIILSDPHYSTMMFKSIRGVDREIKFMGSAYVDVEGSLDGDDEDVSVYGIGTNGDDDCAALLLMEVVTIQEWYIWIQEPMVFYADLVETL